MSNSSALSPGRSPDRLPAIRHWRGRELQLLAAVLLTLLLIGLHLGAGLRLAGQEGSGWRAIDLPALQRRIESGELREREAHWYHPATEQERGRLRGRP